MEFDEKETEKTLVRYVLLILLDIDHSSDIFKDHLSREYCEENVMFWRETNKFKKLAKDGSDDKAARKLALAIVSQFIVSKGSTPINISDLTRAKIQARLEDKAVHANMFQEAVSEIEQLMAQGPFPRFTRKLQTAITSSWKLTTDKLSVNEFGKILYMNWFMLCPDIMPFFKGDLVKHGNMLVGMVEAAVGLLDDLKKLIPKLVTLGKRHVKYGARAELFESLGKALVQTMQESLESEWTSEMAVAWHTVFKMMSCVLIHSMQRHAEEESVSGKSGTSDRSRLSHVLVKSGLPLLLELDFRSSVMKDQLVYFYKKEHLLFWREVYDYQDLAVDGNKHKELLHSAKQIYAKYIAGNAQTPIKLPNEVRDDIKAHLDKGKVTADLFDEAWNKVETMMEERPFPRFSQELGVDIQKSWDGLTERLSVHKIGKIVFMNFFIKRPEVMPLFNKDVEKHGAMIAGMVDMAIQSIGDLKGLMPALISIGERHKDFGGGVKPEQFDALGDAFVDTLKDSLKEEFSPSMEKSWRTIFFFMSQVMQNAMNQAEINGSETGSGTGRSNTPSPKSQLQPPSPRAASAARNMELSRSDRSDSMKDDESLSKYRKDGKGDKDKCAVM